MVESGTHQQIGYILRSYPRLSQTFILNEILALEQLGVPIRIFALAHPHEPVVQPQVQQIQAPVHYLRAGETRWERIKQHFAVMLRHPVGYFRAMGYGLRRREIDRGYATSTRIECLHLAVSLVHRLDQEKQAHQAEIQHLHAHFAHDPTFIAQMVHLITAIPFSFTAHARDLYQIAPKVLAERINQASTVVTCCQTNLQYLTQTAPQHESKYKMINHGVDLRLFHPRRVDERPQAPPLIVSVGRLVEKKGFFDLLSALAQVNTGGINFECQIYGDGPLQPELQQWIETHGLSGCVKLAGACTQAELVRVLQRTSIFVLTPAVTEDGDRDGIPNVLAEAMAVGLPVISTATAGIPELITHNLNGLLYPAHDINGIAAGLIDLLGSSAQRERLGCAAREKVMAQFDLFQAAARLADLFLGTTPPRPSNLFASLNLRKTP